MPTQEFRIVLDGDSSGFVRALKQAGVQVNTLDKNVSQATPKLAALSSTFLRIGAVWGGAVLAGAGYMAKVASETENLNLSFKVLLKSGDAAKKMMGDLKAFADRTPFTLLDAAKATRDLLNFGVTAKEIPRWLTTIGDAASAATVPFEQAAMTLGRIKSGMVGIDEIVSIGLTKEILRDYGVKFTKSWELVSTGAVAAEAALKALEDRVGGMMAEQALTLAGRISTLGDAFKGLITDPNGKGIGDAIARELKQPISDLTDTFGEWKASGVTEDMGKAIGDMVKSGAKNITSLIETVGKLAKEWDKASESTKHFAEFGVKTLIVGGPLMMGLGGLGKSVIAIAGAWKLVTGAATTATVAQTAAGAAGAKAAAGGLAAFIKLLSGPAFVALMASLGYVAAGGVGEDSLGAQTKKKEIEREFSQQRQRLGAIAEKARAQSFTTGVRPQTEIEWDWKGEAYPAQSPTGQAWKTMSGGSGPLPSLKIPVPGDVRPELNRGGSGVNAVPPPNTAAADAKAAAIENAVRYIGELKAKLGISGPAEYVTEGKSLAQLSTDNGIVLLIASAYARPTLFNIPASANWTDLGVKIRAAMKGNAPAWSPFGATRGLLDQASAMAMGETVRSAQALDARIMNPDLSWKYQKPGGIYIPSFDQMGTGLAFGGSDYRFLQPAVQAALAAQQAQAAAAQARQMEQMRSIGGFGATRELMMAEAMAGGPAREAAIAAAKLKVSKPAGGLTGFQQVSQSFGALSSLLGGTGGGVMGGIGAGIQAWGLGESLFAAEGLLGGIGVSASMAGPIGLVLGGLGGLFEGIFGSSGPSVREQLEKIERNTRPLGKVFDVRWASTPSSLMPAGMAYAGASRGAF
jgi:hypothetical protein